MNRKRSVLSALLALSLVCAACGIRTNLAPEAEEDLIVVGMCQVGAESDWRVANSVPCV